MKVSANTLKWVIRFYPALFFQRIWVIAIAKDFSYAKVRVKQSFLNRNGNGSIFGGSIAAAGDPFFVLLFYQHFVQKGFTLKSWLKSLHINFTKPAFSDLILHFEIKEEEWIEAEKSLNLKGKFVQTFTVRALNNEGEICANIEAEVYLRNLTFNLENK